MANRADLLSVESLRAGYGEAVVLPDMTLRLKEGEVLALLGRTRDQLQSVGSGLGETSALDALTRSGQADALRGLAEAAKQLPPPVDAMIGQFGVRTVAVASTEAHADLAHRYQDQVSSECQKLVAGRYPLGREGAGDVPLEDFAQVFGPTGVFEKFFHENLEPLVDTSSSPWRWRPAAACAATRSGCCY